MPPRPAYAMLGTEPRSSWMLGKPTTNRATVLRDFGMNILFTISVVPCNHHRENHIPSRQDAFETHPYCRVDEHVDPSSLAVLGMGPMASPC